MLSKQRSEYREIRNILKRTLLSRVALALFIEVALTLSRKIRGKFKYAHLRYYPADARKISDTLCEVIDYESNHKVNAISSGPKQLKLATGYLKFDAIPNWQQPLDEREQYVSLHRWNWLLFALTEQPETVSSEWGESLIRSWLSEMSPLPTGDASESYTIGERISNTCLFFRHTNGHWDGVSEDITSALHIMGLYLSQRIEYYSGDLSGNHVVNNSRAILFAGYCCKDEVLTLLGRTVLQDQLPKIVDKYGFLREGSSHYQFLFTRWILEIRMMAMEVSDTETLDIVQPLISKILNACHLFLIKDSNGRVCMPTIGDVSPDCNPEWLLDLLNSPLAGLRKRIHNTRGWASLFNNFDCVDCPTELKDAWPALEDSDWGRVDFKGWTAIWHIEDSNGKIVASHAHHDFTSFVLFLDGEEVLIDPGRYSYESDAMGRHGVEACAHNTIQLDGFPPMLSRGDKALPSIYKNSNCVIKFKKNTNNIVLTIKHDGFRRLSDTPIIHTREFLFTDETCEISDYIEGEGKYLFESFLQWPADEDNLGVRFDLIEYENKVEIDYSSAMSDSPIGWRFPVYLKKVPCITQRFYSDIELPLKLGYKITKK
jgi:hypothetical protein